MSVIVTANYEGETFEVEIFRDGSLDFPGHSLEHDRTVAALGGEPSLPVRFENIWSKGSYEVIFNNLELPENSNALLAADCAEHVLYIYETKYQGDLRPRQAIDAARDFVVGKIDLPTLERAQAEAKVAAEAAAWAARAAAWTAQAAEEWAAEWAARAAAWTAQAAARAAAWTAAEAAAYNVSSDSDSVEWKQAYDAEVAWQVRRFVDCMEAVGQGKDWPDMKETP